MPMTGSHRWLFFALLLWSVSASGQTFSVSVSLSPEATGRATLSIYDGTKLMPQYSARVAQGRCVLQGRLLKAQPYYAELNHPSWAAPVGFFIEPGEMTVEQGHVRGSKANSEYRMLLEQPDNLEAYVLDQPSSLYAPTLLLLHLTHLPYVEQQHLFDSLRGDALASSHYKPLQARLELMGRTAEGARLSDQLFGGEHPTLLLFTAPWCEPCQRAQRELEALHPYVIDLEQQPRLWDDLAIPYIPYIITLDTTGVILQRDLRWWEVRRATTY